MQRYLIDSNIFITAKNTCYRFTFCSNFWGFLLELFRKGKLYSLKVVRNELLAKDDELKAWIEESIDEKIFLDQWDAIEGWIEVTEWARTGGRPFTASALEEFAEENEADAWLIAYAKEFDYKIITNEVLNSQIQRKVLLVDAALNFGVECINLYDFLEKYSENFKFKN